MQPTAVASPRVMQSQGKAGTRHGAPQASTWWNKGHPNGLKVFAQCVEPGCARISTPDGSWGNGRTLSTPVA